MFEDEPTATGTRAARPEVEIYMTTTTTKLTFRIFNGSQLVREESLSQSVIKLGKVASAHLRLDDDSVSRMHAIIEVNNDVVSIIDLGSTRGTIVNGKKINKATLQSGDVITLGDTRVELAIALAAVAVAAPLPPPLPVIPVRTAPVAVAVAAPAMPVLPTTMSTESDDPSGARAVEVAAMFGESVVSVKHVSNPKGGKLSGTTLGLFATGAAALLSTAIAFGGSIHTAAKDKAALDNWTHVQNKPARAFRAHQGSTGVDIAGLGGLALGVACLGLARARQSREKAKTPTYRIGTAAGVELALETAPSADYALVAPKGDDFVFNYNASMEGEMTLDGKSTSLATLAQSAQPSATVAGAVELPIPHKAKIRAKSGNTTFLVSSVAKPREEANPLFAPDRRMLGYAAASLGVHLAAILFLQTIPVDDTGMGLEMDSNESLAMRMNQTNKDDKVEETKPTEGGNNASKEASQEAASMKLEAGTAGKKEVDHKVAGLQMANNNTDPAVAKERLEAAREEARTAGILGSTAIIQDSIRSVTGEMDISSGIDANNVYGVYGADGGGTKGFGFARSGNGVGGGCTVGACGISGTGRYGTLPGGSHGGDGYDAHIGGPQGHGHTPTDPGRYIGKPIATPGMDKEIIKRYIKRQAPKIAYCYERKLLGHEDLGGELNVSFFIAADGSVQSSTATGFDSEVGACVATVVKDIQFPRTEGGAGVQVNYPFTFHRVGSESK